MVLVPEHARFSCSGLGAAGGSFGAPPTFSGLQGGSPPAFRGPSASFPAPTGALHSLFDRFYSKIELRIVASESCSLLPDCQGAGVALPQATSSKCVKHYDSVCRCAAAGISDPAAAFWGGQFQSTTLHGASPVRGALSSTEPMMQTKPAATDTLVEPAPPGCHAVLHPHRHIGHQGTCPPPDAAVAPWAV